MADPDSLQNASKKPKINKHALACSLLASASCISFGYDLAVLADVENNSSNDLKPSPVESSVLMLIPLCYILSTKAASRAADRIGRRYTLLLGGTLFFAGSVIRGSAPNFPVLMVGLFLASVGGCSTFMAAPIYAAEISPDESRGFLTSLPDFFNNVGSLLGGISCYGFSKLPTHLGWRLIVGIPAFPSGFLCIGLLVLSESPRWLVMKGRPEDAGRVLDKISDSPEESLLKLDAIRNQSSIPQNGNTTCCALKELFIRPTPPVRHMVVTVLGIHFFQQACGVGLVALYTTVILQKAGVKREIHQQLISLAIGFTGAVCSLVATVLVDKIGRRTLLLYSVGGMVFSLMGLSIGLTIIHHYPNQKLMWALAMCTVCSLSSVAFFSIGLSPIAWIYSSEVFPSRLRAAGNGMAGTLNIFIMLVLAIAFPILIFVQVNIGRVFFFFSGMAILAWVFIYLFLPETKGRSLEEMEALFIGLGPFCSDRIRKWRQNDNCRMFFDNILFRTLSDRFHVSLW